MRPGRLLAVAALTLVLGGCASPPRGAPPLEGLDAREILALAPRAVGALGPVDRARLRATLDAALTGEAAEAPASPRDPGAIPAAAVVALALPAPVRLALALDLDRREAGKKPLLAVSVAGATVSPLPVASLYAPSGSSTAKLPLTRLGDDTLPLSDDLLVGLRAALGERAGEGDPVTLRSAIAAPFAMLYVAADRTLYVNPVLLALREDAADRTWAAHAGDSAVDTHLCGDGSSDLACLTEALALRTVALCVERLDPRCLPASGQTLNAIVTATPTCAFTIQTCMVEPTLDSPCAIAGPCGTPCSVSGAQSGSACGRGCGQACTTSSAACGLTASCDKVCVDFCSQPCGSQCASSCEQDCANCGASAGASTSRSCTRACGESGARHTGLLTDGVNEVRNPLPPAPPLDPRRGPTLRAIAITGARDATAFLLPPLLFFAWQARLGRARRPRPHAPSPGAKPWAPGPPPGPWERS